METIWTKLPAPHAVIETSLRNSSQERNFLLQRPGGETGSFGSIAGAETALTREFGRHVFEIAALLRVSRTLYNYRVWVVETIWTKLAAPHAGIEPSLRKSSQERNFLLQRPGSKMGSFASIAGTETALTNQFGGHAFENAALLRVSHTLYNYRVWVVEVVGHKLKTHHPVIEPVSDSESGTEFFDAETEGPDPPFCIAETHAETRTNSKKPAVHGTNARITRGVRYLKTGWWCAQSDTNRSRRSLRELTGQIREFRPFSSNAG